MRAQGSGGIESRPAPHQSISSRHLSCDESVWGTGPIEICPNTNPSMHIMKTNSMFQKTLCLTLALFTSSSLLAKDKKDDDDSKKKKKGSPSSQGSSRGPQGSGGPSGGGPSRPSGGPSGKPSSGQSGGMSRSGPQQSGPSSRPSGGMSGGPSGGMSRSQPQPSGPSRSTPSGPSRNDSRSAPQYGYRQDAPRHIEPQRRPSMVLETRPLFRPFLSPYSYRQPQPVGVTAADVQHALAQRGFYYGPIDGGIGPMTRRAIAAFQAEVGLPVTGEITISLLRALRL